MVKRLLKKGKIIHIDIPFQSGSRRILKLMRRFNDTEKMKEAYLRIRNKYPEISLTTQNIVGFPTETEEDFKQTLSLIKDVGFNGGYLYRFSLKTGTTAETIAPKVPKNEIARRMKIAKKFLQQDRCSVFYRSIFYSPRFFTTLGFIKA